MRKLLAGLALAFGLAAVPMATGGEQASAWPWDPHVQVLGSYSSCAGATWMWFEGGNGDRGWARLGPNPGTFSFDLYKVPTSGELVKLTWGKNVGSTTVCSKTKFFVISRPIYGSQAAIGYLG